MQKAILSLFIFVHLFACIPFPPQVVFVNGDYKGTLSFDQSFSAKVRVQYMSGNPSQYHMYTEFNLGGLPMSLDTWTITNGNSTDIYYVQSTEDSCDHQSFTNATRHCTSWQQTGNVYKHECMSANEVDTTTVVLDVNNFVIGLVVNATRLDENAEQITSVYITQNYPIPPPNEDFTLPTSCNQQK